ncbi:esterase [Treponema ruminis]|uniref:alpha/beta hydrolase-fold protein n=1 Tax=Treponema ruminis TaxID=744515 RepID=UPI0019825C31|nr:alpha/beta hydrolase-fold protein [Treponema ruminis]QSI03354.1 esterase [Treponema ruminis]
MMDRCRVGNREIRCHLPVDARFVWLQPTFDEDYGSLDRELGLISSKQPFGFVAFPLQNWNDELSPWPAPPVYGNEPFGGKGEETLAYMTGSLLPWVKQRQGDVPVGVGGYSLAGLFALWAATRTSAFASVVAASPSVWFPGWADYEREHHILARRVYLSLGLKEEKTRNVVMRQVGDRIRFLEQELRGRGVDVTLQWNPGGHFMPSDERCAKGYTWALR